MPNIQKIQLDSSQQQFVDLNEKYIRLLAPAGAGKTNTLLYRCKSLLEKNPHERFLLFTFTRVAADELRIRLKTNPDFQQFASNITVTTLNSYGMRIVKNKASVLSSYRSIEKKERIWTVINTLSPVLSKSSTIEKKMSDKRWRAFNAAKLLDMIDLFKSLAFDHENIHCQEDFIIYWKRLAETGLAQKLESIIEDMARLGICNNIHDMYDNFFRFYVAATDQLKSMNLYTLEDQKYWGWKYSEKGSKLTGAARYSHIMVDEFQDINPIDLLFIKSIRNQHNASLVIVGDDDQAIFEWRGATPQYILNPGPNFGTIKYPFDFKTCILNKNYRSPSNVVHMAQQLIRNNQVRVDKNTVPVRKDKAKITIDSIDNYDAIVQEILLSWEKPEIRNIAVITRKRSQLIPYQIIFASKKIPFFAAEDLNVFLTDAFNSLKDLIEIKQYHKEGRPPSFLYYNEAILKLCDRIRKYPLNKTEREKLRTHMFQEPFSCCGDALKHLAKFSALATIFRDNSPCQVIEEFFEAKTVSEMLELVGQKFTGLQKDFRKADDDIFYADPPFAELASFSARYGDAFDHFYFDVQKAISTLAAVLRQDDDEITEKRQSEMANKLHLMTSLRTKGKEYDAVFILTANSDIWPIHHATTDERLEAERRLFYVAVTRVRKELHFMVNPKRRPSPYLVELGLIDNDNDDDDDNNDLHIKLN